MVKFQDPPPGRTKGRNAYADIASELRANPGRWALVLEGVNGSMVASIKQGRMTAFQPAGSFEAVSRKRPDKDADIYARYVGEPKS